MEATSVYPNSAPVLAVSGLGVALAGIDPDQVPLEPDLVNDARRRFAPGGSAVDACGVMRLHVRNALGYAFLRPHQRDKLRLVPTERQRAKEKDWRAQINFFRSNYRHFVPPDLLMDYLQHECPYVHCRCNAGSGRRLILLVCVCTDRRRMDTVCRSGRAMGSLASTVGRTGTWCFTRLDTSCSRHAHGTAKVTQMRTRRAQVL
jgi:hypothetical protein